MSAKGEFPPHSWSPPEDPILRNSGSISQLMSWQNAHDLYQKTMDWKDQMPANLTDRFRSNEPKAKRSWVSRWDTLREKIAAEDWGGTTNCVSPSTPGWNANWVAEFRSAGKLLCMRPPRMECRSPAREHRGAMGLEGTGGTGVLDHARQSQGQRIARKRLYQIYAANAIPGSLQGRQAHPGG